MRNPEIAAHFDELAVLYELDGADRFRVLAYRNAAKAIKDSGASVAELARQGRAGELDGVGKTIADKIDALLESGSIPSAEKLKAKIPVGLIEITRIPGLGPKRVRQLHDELGIKSLEELKSAAEAGRLKDVPGFGKKAQDNVIAALAKGPKEERTLLSKALEVGEALVDGLRHHPASNRVELAGSARRWADSCKDLDIVASASDPKALVEAFAELPGVEDVRGSGTAGAKAMTYHGIPVDLRIVPDESFGNLLQHFTGSGRHNEALRTAAVKRGFHVSEYGVKNDETEVTHACETEEEVYELLGLPYIPPELRENRGELTLDLPELIELSDIRGDLHCHTTLSDGRNTLTEMATAAKERGYSYLALTDHSATHGFGNHVTAADLLRRVEQVRDFEMKGFDLLVGTETNILPDGTVDYGDDVLEQLDWVVGSVHTSFRMKEVEMTKRICAAMENPLIDAIGHPTGRLIGRREPYDVDVEALIETAASTGTFLEINANPNRRDLNDVYVREAAKAGAKLVIDSDAHGTETLANMRYGIATARRGWLTKGDVANTRTWKQLQKLRKR